MGETAQEILQLEVRLEILQQPENLQQQRPGNLEILQQRPGNLGPRSSTRASMLAIATAKSPAPLKGGRPHWRHLHRSASQ